MKQWYIKQLSEMTKVSVRTLHHYDNIGLLKPSARLKNGYRLYTEADLLKLQQIIALKFFGFKLSQIKHLEKYTSVMARACEQYVWEFTANKSRALSKSTGR